MLFVFLHESLFSLKELSKEFRSFFRFLFVTQSGRQNMKGNETTSPCLQSIPNVLVTLENVE